MATALDSQYASGVARLLYQTKRQRDDLGRQGRDDQADFDTMLHRMARDRATSLQNQNHQANREGLFYSGQLTKRRGDTERQYGEKEQDARTDLDRRATARASALNDLGTVVADPNSPLGYRGTGGAAFDLQDMFSSAVGRQLERDQGLQLQRQDDVGAPAAAGGAAGGPGYKVVLKNGRKYHVYNGGKAASDWRFVGAATH